MTDEGSQRGPFWTSLPGILTGAAALITAVSGLAVWHNKTNPQPAPPAVVQQAAPQPTSAPLSATTTSGGVQATTQEQSASRPSSSAAPGSQPWCAEKYKAWADEKAESGVDDAGLRKELTHNHCRQYGFILGKVQPQR